MSLQLGCNTGIGRVTAHELSKNGARIIMLCRNTEAAKKVAKEITEDTGREVNSTLQTYYIKFKIDLYLSCTTSYKHY